MSVGAGLVWSTVLLLLALAVYQISTRKKWKIVGKVLGVLVVVCGTLGGAYWAWMRYQARPQIVLELNAVRLGMTPVEVKLAKGKPTNDETAKIEKGDKDDFTLLWTFQDSSYGAQSSVRFFGKTESEIRASIICEKDGYSQLLGLRQNNSEQDVLDTLGKPTRESINKEGLSKLVYFKPWNVGFEFTKGAISQLCISDNSISYIDEYKNDKATSPTSDDAK